jgi:hypothetical protein
VKEITISPTREIDTIQLRLTDTLEELLSSTPEMDDKPTRPVMPISRRIHAHMEPMILSI